MTKRGEPEPFDRYACLRFVRRNGPCTLREISFACCVTERRLRDHMRLHPDLYSSQKSTETGIRVWYATCTGQPK